MTNQESPQILALKERYKRSFEDKVQMLSDYVAAIESEEATLNQVSELRGFLHKLAGSSGMYGYDDISEASRKAMELAGQVENTAHVDGLSVSTLDVVHLLESHS